MQTQDDQNVYRFGDRDLPSNETTKKSLQQYYDRFYESSEFRYYDERTTKSFLRALLRRAGVPDNSRILDVGCATGFYTEQFRDIGSRSVGIDISRIGVLKGREKYSETQLAAGDASKMPFKMNSFDAVFMLGCSLTNTRDLQAIQSYHTYLTGFLRNGGVVISIGGSDFSGNTAQGSEWIYHTYEQIRNFVNRNEVDAEGPYITNLKLVSKIGRIGISKTLTRFLLKLPGSRRWTLIFFIRKKTH